MEYKVSVITPVHNTNPEFFEKCAESVRSQSIGFDRIQWIVVLHNCGEERTKELRAVLERYPGAEVHVLKNDARTPSSPRNYGLTFAKGEYIGFLDADDCYTSGALEEAIAHNSRYDADFVVFRREFEMENSNVLPIKDTVMWNQLSEEILVNPKETDTEFIFSGLCGMVTSKLYKREFILGNRLRFDEEVCFAEDYLFIMDIFSCTEKVLFLPQMIGYHYFINTGSLVQNSAKDGKTLINYAQGYAKVFERGLRQGFHMNCIISRLCVVLARFMVKNPDISFEDRVAIKNLMEPYILLTVPMKPGKVYSRKACEEGYNFPREVILHPEKWMDADGKGMLVMDNTADLNNTDPMVFTLHRILEDNAETDYGTRFGFESLMTVSGYQNRVPCTSYEDYRPLIRLATRIGQTDILTKDEVFSYVFSDEETGIELFPFTKKHILPYVGCFKKLVDGHNTLLLMESSFLKERYNDDALSNSLNGLIVSAYFNHADMSPDDIRAEFSSPRELMFPERNADLTYARLFFALSDRDLDQILAQHTWRILETVQLLKANWRKLCDDIENGTLSVDKNTVPQLYRRIDRLVHPNKDRADELRAVFAEGFNGETLKKIWPGLRRVIGTGDGEMQIYTDLLLPYLGSVPVAGGMLASPVCLIGEPTEIPEVYRIPSSAGFFEFMQPGGEKKVLQHFEIEPGEEYELIITNMAGLYRYRTKQTVRIVSCDGADILFRYAGRETDDRLERGRLYSVIREAGAGLGVPCADYSYFYEDGCLNVVWEVPEDEEGRPASVSCGTDLIGERLKAGLARAGLGQFTDVRVSIGQPQTHLLYRDKKNYQEHFSPDDEYPVRYLDTPEKKSFFTFFTVD